jgi:hypothetical protein
MIKKLCNHQTWLEYRKKSQALLNTEAQSNKFYWSIFSHSHHIRINQSQQLISNKNLIIYICMKFVYHSNQQNTVYNEKKLFKVVFSEKLTEECVTLMEGCRFAVFRTPENKFDVWLGEDLLKFGEWFGKNTVRKIRKLFN